MSNKTSTSETRNILIVDENVAPLTLAVIRSLGKIKEYRLHVLSFGKNKYPQFRYSKYIKSFVLTEFIDDYKAFSFIKERAVDIKTDMIIPVNEKMVKVMSVYRNECSAICRIPLIPELDTFNIVRNKLNLYNWLFENHYPGDKPVMLEDAINDENVRKELLFPLLIKPNVGSGGKGIRYVKDLAEFESILPDFNDSYDFVIQRIIPGHDIDISLLARDGTLVAYAIQQSIEDGKRLAYARSIQFIHNEELLNLTSSIIKKLNFSGIAHLDFRYDNDQKNYKLVDFNSRYWSSLLGSLAAGINFPWLAINFENNKNNHEYNCVRYSMDLNIFRIFKKRIPFRNTEFYYNLRDPFPFLIDLVYKIGYHARKLPVNIGKIRKSAIQHQNRVVLGLPWICLNLFNLEFNLADEASRYMALIQF